jgi:hypothetical protein
MRACASKSALSDRIALPTLNKELDCYGGSQIVAWMADLDRHSLRCGVLRWRFSAVKGVSSWYAAKY